MPDSSTSNRILPKLMRGFSKLFQLPRQEGERLNQHHLTDATKHQSSMETCIIFSQFYEFTCNYVNICIQICCLKCKASHISTLTHTTTSLFYRFSGELFKLVYSLVCVELKFLPIEQAAIRVGFTYSSSMIIFMSLCNTLCT